MLITATTAILFLIIALACVAIGHYVKRVELYAFGILLMFLFGGFIWFNGISEQTGEIVVKNNTTGTDTTMFTYEQNRELWVDILSVAAILLGVGLALNLYGEYEKEKQRSREEDIDAR